MFCKNIQLLFIIVLLFFDKILLSSTFFFSGSSGGCCPCAPPPPPVVQQSCPVCAPPSPPPISSPIYLPISQPIPKPIPLPVFSPIFPQSQTLYSSSGCNDNKEYNNFNNNDCNKGAGSNCNDNNLNTDSLPSTFQQYIPLPVPQNDNNNYQQFNDAQPPSPSPIQIIPSMYSSNFENNYASSLSQPNSDNLKPLEPLIYNKNSNEYDSFISQPIQYKSFGSSTQINLLPHQIKNAYIPSTSSIHSTGAENLYNENDEFNQSNQQNYNYKSNEHKTSQSLIDYNDKLTELPSKDLTETDAYEDKLTNIDDYENLVTTNSPIYLADKSDLYLPNINKYDKRTTILPNDTLNSENNSYKKKILGVQQSPEIKRNSKCSNETLRLIMHKNIVSNPTISKQLIFKAGRMAFGEPIDVICSKNKFSYTVVSSKVYCEASRGRITCFAFLQP